MRRSSGGGELEEDVLEAVLEGAEVDQHVPAGSGQRADALRRGAGHHEDAVGTGLDVQTGGGQVTRERIGVQRPDGGPVPGQQLGDRSVGDEAAARR